MIFFDANEVVKVSPMHRDFLLFNVQNWLICVVNILRHRNMLKIDGLDLSEMHENCENNVEFCGYKVISHKRLKSPIVLGNKLLQNICPSGSVLAQQDVGRGAKYLRSSHARLDAKSDKFYYNVSDAFPARLLWCCQTILPFPRIDWDLQWKSWPWTIIRSADAWVFFSKICTIALLSRSSADIKLLSIISIGPEAYSETLKKLMMANGWE